MMAIIGSAVATKILPGEAVRKRFSGDGLKDITHSSKEAFHVGWEPALPPTKCFEGEDDLYIPGFTVTYVCRRQVLGTSARTTTKAKCCQEKHASEINKHSREAVLRKSLVEATLVFPPSEASQIDRCDKAMLAYDGYC
jgi:hypothetical protein